MTISVLGTPGARRQFRESAVGPVIDELSQHVGQIGFGIDAVQLARLDQRCERCPVFRSFVAAGKQSIFSVQSNHPFILPMSGRKLKFITGGTRSMGAGSGDTTANSVPPGRLFTLRQCPAWSRQSPHGCWTLSPAPVWQRSARRV